MADKSLQARTMRKTVERVDIGAFGMPMRVIGWVKKTKSSWGGWIAMTAGQMAVGVMIAILAGIILGVPVNPFSIAILAGFALGSAIGGPFSFAIWSAILIGMTGLIAGFAGGAWVASPSWWRDLADGWERGENVPGWFMIAIPAWMLFWIVASRGVSKVAEFMFEKLALRMGFRAAQRFTGEDKRVYDEAFEQSDVSEAETASLLESAGDGTHAVITGEPSKIAGVQPSVVREMGGDPDVSPVPLPTASMDSIDYDSYLSSGDDPDILKAVGKKPTGLEPMSEVTETDVSVETPTGVVIEMEPLDLPAVPRDTSPPLQRMEPPKLDPRQNRALFRRMTQLNLAFQTARREDRDAEFIEKHQDELAVISDEQRMILESMADTGPLLALVQSIQQKRTEDFLVGRADAPLAQGDTVTDVLSGGDDEMPFDIGDTVPVQAEDHPVATQEPESEELPESHPAAGTEHASDDEAVVPTPRRDIAAMAATFSDILSPRRIRDDASAPSSSSDIGEQDVSIDPVESEHEQSVAAIATDAMESSGADAEDAVTEPTASDLTAADETVSTEIATASDEIVPTSQAQTVGQEAPRTGFEFEFDVELEERNAEAVAVAAGEAVTDQSDVINGVEDAGAEEPEEEMSNVVFSRLVCRQVLGLVLGPLDPEAKADDVSQFERSSNVSVAEVLNSRSFDEQVGPTDAAAARHAWKDVKQVLSQSSLDRLMSDLERVNLRGEAMVEEPHTLTVVAYHAFETESSRLRRVATSPSDNDAVRMTADLVGRNVAILDTLASILRARSEAAASRASATPGGIVRQKVGPARDDVVASRGRTLIGSVLGGARAAGVGVMRDTPSKEVPLVLEAPEPVVDLEKNDVPQSIEENVMSDEAAEISSLEPVAVPHQLRPGDEGFVSSHPADSVEYQVEMEMHAVGVAARQRVEAAARERAEQEKAERIRKEQEAEEDRIRAEQEAEAARRAEQEAEEARVRQEQEADEARRLAADEAERNRREEIARIERETAEAARRRELDEAEAAALAVERERAAAARTKEDEALLKQARDRQREMDIPERFRTEEIVSHMLALAELRNIRFMFQRSVIGAKVEGMSDVEAAMRIPAVRSQLQTEAEMVREAAGVLTRIAAVVDATDPEDAGAIRSALNPDEVPFFEKIIGQIERGRVAMTTLERADEADAELRRRAERASETSSLEATLRAANEELERLRSEATASAETTREAIERAERAEREGRAAAESLEKIRKEMAGIVDDDFQKVLEKDSKRIDNVGVDGLFSFMSPDNSSMVVVMTTPSSTFPDGLIQRGSKSLTFADFIEFVVTRAREMETDHVAVFFTDPKIRAYSSNAGAITFKQVRRSVEELKTMLSDYGVNIENQGE